MIKFLEKYVFQTKPIQALCILAALCLLGSIYIHIGSYTSDRPNDIFLRFPHMILHILVYVISLPTFIMYHKITHDSKDFYNKIFEFTPKFMRHLIYGAYAYVLIIVLNFSGILKDIIRPEFISSLEGGSLKSVLSFLISGEFSAETTFSFGWVFFFYIGMAGLYSELERRKQVNP